MRKKVVFSTLSLLLLGVSLTTNLVKADPITVGAVIATAQQVKSVVDQINTDRSVVLEVDNNTDLTLRRIADNHSSGGFAVPPKSEISPKTAEVFGSQKKGSALFTGTVGSVTYAGDEFNLAMEA